MRRHQPKAQMGLTHVPARVEGFSRTGEPYEGTFLVDTGSIDCLVCATALVKAGIQEEGRDTYELASGELVEYAYGFARIRFLGCQAVTKVIFGPEGVEPILGVIALESAGIIVDPVNETLRRLRSKPLKRAA
jgi:clan AA aspartic protease